MSGFDNLFASAEQKYGLPPGILAATAKVESSLNPRAVSEAGAQGLMQLLPSTARNLGANPLDPPSAVDAAGRLWAQNLKASGGDIDRAAMMYHGGTDTRQWGPKTHAYPQKLAAALGPQQPQPGGGDPIEAALSGEAPVSQQNPPAQQDAPADPHDPIESALAGGGQGRQTEIATAQAQAAKQLQEGDEKGAATTLAAHNLQMAPGELDAFHAGKRSAGFNHVDQLPDQPAAEPQTSQGLGFYQGLMKPLDNAATWLKEGADKIGVGSAISGLGQDLGLPSLDQANSGHQAYIKGQEAQGETPGGWGQLAGSIVSSLPIAAATKNPAVLGAIGGALDSDNPNDPREILKNALIGGVGGKATDVGVGAVTRAISPQVSAAVQKLHDLGVQMTPGQILGGGLKKLEDGATSLPGVGDLINGAQRRSILSLNRGIINDRVLAPIGKGLPAGLSGRDAVSFADDAVTGAYHDLLPKLGLQADKPLYDGVAGALQKTVELPAERAAQVHNIVKNSVIDRFNPDWSMSGDTFKDVDSKLGFLQRQYGSAQDPDQQKMAEIFGDVKDALRGKLAEQNPAHAEPLGKINQAFANLVRVQGAASSIGAKEGVFTPSQLASAVKRFNSSARKKDFANGDALLQDVSDAADKVLPRSVPDSGTPYRSIVAYLLGGGINPSTLLKAAPLAVPSMLYTKGGQQAFQRAVLAERGPGAKALAKALTKLKAPLAVAGGGATAQAANGF